MTRHEILRALLRDGNRCLSWRKSKRALLVRAIDEATGEEWARAAMEFISEVLTPGRLPASRERLLEIAWAIGSDQHRKDAMAAFFRESEFRLIAAACVRAKEEASQ